MQKLEMITYEKKTELRDFDAIWGCVGLCFHGNKQYSKSKMTKCCLPLFVSATSLEERKWLCESTMLFICMYVCMYVLCQSSEGLIYLSLFYEVHTL